MVLGRVCRSLPFDPQRKSGGGHVWFPHAPSHGGREGQMFLENKPETEGWVFERHGLDVDVL